MGFPQWANATVATAKEWATSTTEKYKTAVQQAAGVVRPKCKLLSQTVGTVVLPRCKRMAGALRATVKGNLRYYVERTFLLIAGSVGLALATYYLWPIMRRVAVVYYATTDVTKTSAFFVSLVALYVAWSNYRRGNSAIVRLVNVRMSGHSRLGVNNNQFYSTFEVLIKVLGIPLRKPLIVIKGRGSFGEMSCPLMQFEDDQPAASTGTLEKGMIAAYGLRSIDPNPGQWHMVAAIVDPKTEQVAICVYSNGYFVKRFLQQRKPLVGRAVRRWNNWAATFNFRYMSLTRIKWGKPVLFTRNIVPLFSDRMFPLEQFASALKEESQRQPNPIAPSRPR